MWFVKFGPLGNKYNNVKYTKRLLFISNFVCLCLFLFLFFFFFLHFFAFCLFVCLFFSAFLFIVVM